MGISCTVCDDRLGDVGELDGAGPGRDRRALLQNEPHCRHEGAAIILQGYGVPSGVTAMAHETDTLSKARLVLERTLMRVVRDLADMDQNASVHTVEEMASQIAALQAGIEALDSARTAADRYQPTYFGDR